MTSDAKIGLLLGLVFIFVIAFIINGLPNLRGKPNNNELTTNMVNVRENSLGLAQKERNAQEALSGTQTQQKLAIDINELALSPTQDDGQVRMTMPLPGNTSGAARPSTMGGGGIEPNMAAEPVGPVPSDERQLPGSKLAAGFAKPETQKTYTVRKGDVLSEIAKKVYGPVEGKKQENIDRIFQANRNQLKSPAKILVGQKLVIPPLTTTGKVDKSKPTDVLTGPAFERVESVGEKHVEPSAKEPAQTRWYVVQDGDNLWKIAASQLGNGTRYSEIAKLNGDVLKNESDLPIGMRLRLPSQ